MSEEPRRTRRGEKTLTVKMKAPEPKPRRREKPADAEVIRQEIAQKSLIPTLLILRIALASLIFAAVLILDVPSFIRTVLLAVAALLCIYDVAVDALIYIIRLEFLESPVMLLISTILLFLIGFGSEAVAMLILYRVGRALTDFVADNRKSAAMNSVAASRYNTLSLTEKVFEDETSDYIRLESVMRISAGSVLAAAVVLAVLFAVLMPLIAHYNVRLSIHRAVCIILAAVPESLVASMPVIGYTAVCFCSSLGIVFRNALTLESVDGSRNLILEKDGIYDDPEPARVIYAHSDILDTDTLLKFVYHIVYQATQPFAKAIVSENAFCEYNPELITGFQEYPGGISAEINGAPVLFGTKNFVTSRNMKVPEVYEEDGICYYLFLAGRFGGILVISEPEECDISDITQNLKESGINKCTLIASQTNEEVAEFAQIGGFHEIFGGISAYNRGELFSELLNASSSKKILITAQDTDCEALNTRNSVYVFKTASDDDDFGNSDCIIRKESIDSISTALETGRRVDMLAVENAVFVFVIKAILIFLCMTGYANAWMVILADMLAVIATLFNSERVKTKSLISMFLDREIRKPN